MPVSGESGESGEKGRRGYNEGYGDQMDAVAIGEKGAHELIVHDALGGGRLGLGLLGGGPRLLGVAD